MPKLDVEIAEQLPEPQEGHTYTIGEVELFTSQVKSYKGIRVAMTDLDTKDEVVAAIWMRDVAGTKSKLGSFIVALGVDTKDWEGKTIKFVKWRDKDREIAVVNK